MPEVRAYHAGGRLLGLHIPAGFDSFGGRLPVEDDDRAYVTEPEMPLQVVVIDKPTPWASRAHVHDPVETVAWPARHAVFFCQSGRARVALFDADGMPGGDAVLEPGDALVVTEGHQVETLEPGTRIVEVKQGPFLGEERDRRLLD